VNAARISVHVDPERTDVGLGGHEVSGLSFDWLT
jgi:hypothetical protein